ncbi:MAG: hypothetical protein LBK73_16550 [Treponema sp.]|nr:hypothetical protein [Treponema sp.]
MIRLRTRIETTWVPNYDMTPTPAPKPEDVPDVEVSTPLPQTLASDSGG